jgi:hypothetical protein
MTQDSYIIQILQISCVIIWLKRMQALQMKSITFYKNISMCAALSGKANPLAQRPLLDDA